MKLARIFLTAGMTGLMAGCTSFSVPQYYSQPAKEYQPGQNYWVQYERCRGSAQACSQTQDWVQHRMYKKQYYFE